MQSMFDGLYPPGLQWYWKGEFVREISDAAIAQHVRFGNVPTPHCTMHLYPIDGAAKRVKSVDTAWSKRDVNYSMVIAGVYCHKPCRLLHLVSLLVNLEFGDRCWSRSVKQTFHHRLGACVLASTPTALCGLCLYQLHDGGNKSTTKQVLISLSPNSLDAVWHVFEIFYSTLLFFQEGDDRVRATYGDNYERLQRVKAKFDPENFFHINQNIKPLPNAD